MQRCLAHAAAAATTTTSARRSNKIQRLPSSWIFWSSLCVSCLGHHSTAASFYSHYYSTTASSSITTTTTSSLSSLNNMKMMMKSIAYGPNNQPVWQEARRPTNTNKRDHVLIRVCAAGLNPVDAKGVIGDKLPHSWTTLQSMAQRCIVKSKVIGFDFAGIVVEGGSSSAASSSSSSSFVKGDCVYGILPPSRHGGTLQEYLYVPVNQIARIPDGVTMSQAAALPLVGITALQCLQGAGWHHHQQEQQQQQRKLLVIGASGGTGHVAVQIGRALQPNAKIVAVCSGRNKDFVQSLDHSNNLIVLDYRDDKFIENLKAQGPYDVVMDCVTSGDPRDQANMDYGQILWQHHGGNHGSSSSSSSSSPFLTPDAQYRRLGGAFPDWFRAGIERTTGFSLWSNARSKLFWIQMHNAAPSLQQMAAWLKDGIMPVGAHVALTVPFTPAGVQEGFDALLGRRMVGKVVVEMPAPEPEEGEAVASDQGKKDS